MGGEGSAGGIRSVQHRYGLMLGFTLIELMITIAVLAIILAIAIPNVEIWMVRARIQSAAGKLQQDINWAKGYAIRSGYPVNVSIQGGGGGACAWTISPTATGVLQNVPGMTPAQYANQYQNTPCTVLTSGTFSVTPTGMVQNPTGTITSANVEFQAGGNNPAEYGYWLIQVGGAGDVRSCATASANSTQCNLP